MCTRSVVEIEMIMQTLAIFSTVVLIVCCLGILAGIRKHTKREY